MLPFALATIDLPFTAAGRLVRPPPPPPGLSMFDSLGRNSGEQVKLWPKLVADCFCLHGLVVRKERIRAVPAVRRTPSSLFFFFFLPSRAGPAHYVIKFPHGGAGGVSSVQASCLLLRLSLNLSSNLNASSLWCGLFLLLSRGSPASGRPARKGAKLLEELELPSVPTLAPSLVSFSHAVMLCDSLAVIPWLLGRGAACPSGCEGRGVPSIGGLLLRHPQEKRGARRIPHAPSRTPPLSGQERPVFPGKRRSR
ncbi:hypothetical protein GQ53DRAFT_97096 [Thozetella sp. PMI_491]|nr:hypothetical protein GQ53DRAFT_97096 [Thozetella sp. PMI_491]